MFKKLMNKKMLKNEKGLTLIELLAVIVILAIVAAIAIPAIGNIINNQRDKAQLADASMMISSAKIAFADGACGGDNKCSNTELVDFVEGITLVSADEVTYNSTDKTWSVKRTLPNALKGTKYSSPTVTSPNTYNITGSVLTANEGGLNEVLGK